ncbi:MAG: transposase [Phycisphaerae bacterium]
MPQSLAQIHLHLIFSTKDRRPVLGDILTATHEYIGGIIRELGSASHRIGGTADHVHALCLLPRALCPAELVQKIKTGSSKWLKKQGIDSGRFAWQKGYGAFSVSASNLGNAAAYIANQAKHHHRRTFQEEYREFLDRHNVQYDERYVWD